MMTEERYHQRRGGSLRRLSRLRELEAPVLIVRTEQMLLWGIRRLYRTNAPDHMAIVDLPEYQQNYAKFIRIHDSVGSA